MCATTAAAVDVLLDKVCLDLNRRDAGFNILKVMFMLRVISTWILGDGHRDPASDNLSFWTEGRERKKKRKKKKEKRKKKKEKLSHLIYCTLTTTLTNQSYIYTHHTHTKKKEY